jgi:hypothetical protein
MALREGTTGQFFDENSGLKRARAVRLKDDKRGVKWFCARVVCAPEFGKRHVLKV